MMMALLAVGGILSFVGGIWLLVLAFKKSVLWGLGSLFLPFVGLIFALMHLHETARPLLLSLAGAALVVIGAWSMGDELKQLSEDEAFRAKVQQQMEEQQRLQEQANPSPP